MLFFRRDDVLHFFDVFSLAVFYLCAGAAVPLYLCAAVPLCNWALQLFCQHINNTELIYRRRTSACVSESVEVS